MHITIVGNEQQRMECAAKFGAQHSYHYSIKTGEDFYLGSEIAFDFTLADRPSSLDFYNDIHLPVFADVSFSSLVRIAEWSSRPLQTTLFGFCGLPTLVNRNLLEVSILNLNDQNILKRICEKLSTAFTIIKDQPGLITARTIAMIINEAYFTLEDGTASREDIDLAMKLGTNYPWGPFEWCERIEKKNVARLLKTIYDETGDERYKLCKALEA